MSFKSVALGDVADVNWGDTSVTKASYVPVGFQAYSATGADGCLPYADYDHQAVVLSAIGARCGKTWFAEGQWSCIKNTIRFWSTDKHLDNRFLFWATAHEDFFPKRGAAQPFITIGDARAARIPLPPLDEQRRIAAILDKADALRRRRKRVLDLLGSLTQSIFQEMFGDPVSNPKNLKKTTIGEIIKVKSGDSLVARNMTAGGFHPVYGGNGINGYHDNFMFSERKLVLGRVGAYCGAVHLTQPMSWITDNALYVSEIKMPVSLVYLKAALSLADLNQYAGRAAQPLISGGRIYLVEVLHPPLELQMEFEAAVSKTETMSSLFTTAASEVELLFTSLQSRAFSGQL